MLSPGTALSYPVKTLGIAAAELVRDPMIGNRNQRTCGYVEAVFESTFYVNSGEGLFCIGHAALEPGPLNCVTATPPVINWQAVGLRPGTAITISTESIQIGRSIRFPLTLCQCWEPRDLSISEATNLNHGLVLFRKIIGSRNVDIGLCRFLLPGFAPAADQYVLRAAENPLYDARIWLANALRATSPLPGSPPGWIEDLCGLGPGLTPSGDDFLAGVLIALHVLDETELKQHLWQAIEPQIREHSNPISLAHLSMAARGLEGATIHGVMNAISLGCETRINSAIEGLSNVGHTSGWDMMTGIVTTLDAWLNSRTTKRRH